ncbi:galactosylceramide sulfotransferase-like [Saccoglossus kowalevskii]
MNHSSWFSSVRMECSRKNVMCTSVLVIFSLIVIKSAVFMQSSYGDVSYFRWSPNVYANNDVHRLKTTLPSEQCIKRFYRPVDCNPVKKLIYIKTHKTGSTTLASIIERYGYTRNLTMAIPKGNHIFSKTSQPFQRSMVAEIDEGTHFDMLTNHARYNRPELDSVIPNATYITILRHPVKQFESSFSYFRWNKYIRSNDPIMELFRNSTKYIDKLPMKGLVQNGQLFDLGLTAEQTLNESIVEEKILSLDREMDLILITEYFDESLLILRDLLCWSVDDILYISNGIRKETQRRNLTSTEKDSILQWNKSDLKLYQYFEKILASKIKQYGPCFEHDLQLFRKRRDKIMEQCLEKNIFDVVQGRESRYVLKRNATEFCLNLWRGDVTFTGLRRKANARTIPEMKLINKTNKGRIQII